MEEFNLVLYLLLALVAFLYASVGHGGASGYLAIMAVMGVSAALMKPSALLMNLAVSMFSFIGFAGKGNFRFSLFWPFAISSIPMAFIGGTITLPETIYKKVLAVFILISIFRMLKTANKSEKEINNAPIWACLISGGLIGLASGMIGIGGGIILSPLILIMGWATLRQTAAISALFIFVNSVSGIIGQIYKETFVMPHNMVYAIIATIIGGILGSYFGSKRFNNPTLRNLLAIGLCIASLKLFFN